ncbi:uncharacterized protein N7498_004230 [Penicillium cinerascens]|uniref:PLC-like phosphodiesterase n=1 Tax=Penicillium cinerascens TaxID=70096 RepID=A0A9W9T7W3_9EURO|nr:uncharacterized protein N7498_004230 [Penicillium cinerascens]KAJ5212584.1 hypothetical protein N7498_004230 [Penicillium cinerascens]
MRWLSLVAILAGLALADDTTTSHTSTSSTSSGTTTSFDLSDASTITGSVALPSGTYETYSTTITLDDGDTSQLTVTSSISGNSSAMHNQTTVTHTSNSVTVLVGGGGTTTLGNNSMNATATASSTSTSTPVINTRPCNGYVEFCGRNYSNITMVAAHNSPFDRPGNAASNQMFDVTTQLNNGIRMLQFQTHYQNGTMLLCHTSCELLNMGTLEAYLTKVAAWMRQNPFDVVTILMGNFDFVAPQNFTDPVMNSGLQDFLYTPPVIPMALHDWPTLSEMILTQKRVVFFLDYQANQTAIPWLMDEFSQMWETPFSPTNDSFPCTQQRPPGLSVQDAENRMYMANHNLNLAVDLGSITILIPNTAVLNQTNGVSGPGSLGWMAENCTRKWDRPPNFLLVDYYNYGSPKNGSVFEVAAEMNNVTYNWKCCGSTSAAVHGVSVSSVSTLLMVAAGIQFLLTAF